MSNNNNNNIITVTNNNNNNNNIQQPYLPTEILLEILYYVPARNLIKYLTLSKRLEHDIRKIIINRIQRKFEYEKNYLLVGSKLTKKRLFFFSFPIRQLINNNNNNNNNNN